MADVRRTKLFGLPVPDEETRQRALADPGPSWRDWFLFEFARLWVVLGFFVVDIWILVYALASGAWILSGVLMVAAFYLQFLGYRALWYRPSDPPLPGTVFHPKAWRLREFGVWTPEADRLRAGLSPYAEVRPDRGDPAEFL